MPAKQIFRRAALLMWVFAAATFLIATRAAAQTESILYNFSFTTGARPHSSIAMDASGNIYGTTSWGGVHGAGMVYELSPGAGGTWTAKVLHSFDPDNGDGQNEQGRVTLDSAGNLYGTTIHGGARRDGIAYKLTPTASGEWTETVLYNFSRYLPVGGEPSGLVLDAAGNLYGTTGGTVFELVAKANGIWGLKVLHAFTNNGQDGTGALYGVMFDAAGNLFGTTCGGGTANSGTVFEMTRSGGQWSEKVIYSFQGSTDGHCPAVGALDASGNFYGTTPALTDFGSVFELSPQAGGGWTKTTLHQFQNNGIDGIEPSGILAIDGAGNIYGATRGGGNSNGFGTAYELTPSASGWTEAILYNFDANGGGAGSPASGVILDGAGNLYGAAVAGGANNGGAVVEVTP